MKEIKITLRLPREQHKALYELSQETNISINSLIIFSLLRYFQKL